MYPGLSQAFPRFINNPAGNFSFRRHLRLQPSALPFRLNHLWLSTLICNSPVSQPAKLSTVRPPSQKRASTTRRGTSFLRRVLVISPDSVRIFGCMILFKAALFLRSRKSLAEFISQRTILTHDLIQKHLTISSQAGLCG